MPTDLYKSEAHARKDAVRILRLCYDKGYLASIDGNISIRLSPKRILMTPSGVHKGLVTETDLVVCNYKGELIKGKRKPTSEIAMHLAVYDERPDVFAVMHAHPPTTVAFSVAGVSLAQCILPESILTLGTIPNVGYATPTTQDVADLVREPLRHFNGMILERHGTLTVGKDLLEAFIRLETIEHTAKITLAARSLGKIQGLPEKEINRLLQLAPAMGIQRAQDEYQDYGTCGRESKPKEK